MTPERLPCGNLLVARTRGRRCFRCRGVSSVVCLVAETDMRLLSLAGVTAMIFGLSVASVRAAEVEAAKLGQKIDSVTLVDRAGKKSSLPDVAGPKATVFVFMSFECPISTSY